MGVWLVNADVLARSRFGLSPLIETVVALAVLNDERPEPWHRSWLATHLPAYRQWLADNRFTREWVDSMRGTSGWVPDFIGMPPHREDVTFEDEIERLRATPPQVAKADVAVAHGGRLPSVLDVPDLTARVADLLEWVWTHAVQPDWPRRSRIFEADILSRSHRLSRHGWAAAIEDLGPRLRWLGEGRLQINTSDRPPRDLSGAELIFIPCSTRRGWVAWDLPDRYALVYPASGLLITAGASAAPAALGRLLGVTRADILTRIDPPKSTSQLVALTGLSLGTIGNHLKVLLDANLVARRRSGASVLYYRTSVADGLLAAQDPPPTAGP